MKLNNLMIIAISSSLFVGACGSQSSSNNAVDPHAGMDHSKMDHSAMKSSPDAAKADYDLQFIDTMIVHHQGAVDMAKVELL